MCEVLDRVDAVGMETERITNIRCLMENLR